MDGLTGRQLLRRFVLVTAILAMTLVGGGLFALHSFERNHQRNELGVTFSHLADATARLNVALAGSLADGDHRVRGDVLNAWRSAAYHWHLIDEINPLGRGEGVRAMAHGEARDRLAGWEPPHWHGFADMALPPGLSEVWLGTNGRTSASDLLAEVLLATSALAHGDGPITRAEAETALMVRRALNHTTLLALLHTGSTTLVREFSEAAEAMQRTLVVVIAGGLAALLLVLLFALWPLADRVERDQRALREALKRAQAADKAKAEFLATMSHELRTPLNGVLGMAALLTSTDLTGRQRSCVEIIQSAGSTLATVLGDIMEYTLLDRGKVKLRSSSFLAEDLARRPAEQLATVAMLKGLDLTIRLDPRVPVQLEGDLERLDHVITNLVANAVKFTQKGHVFVDITASAKVPGLVTLRITVADTGPGVAPEKADRIFRLFEQADQSATRAAGGIGIGLAICSSLVSLMGGTIGLDAPVSGVGALFWVEVPLRVVDPAPWLQASPIIGGHRIALVTASASRRSIIGEVLGVWGATVNAAADSGALTGDRATPHVIILDDQPPHAGAADAVHHLAEVLPAVPVVVLSACDATFDHPACTVLRKPIMPRRLLRSLEKLLSRQAAERLLAGDRGATADGSPASPALSA